jgi:hypothetical protein
VVSGSNGELVDSGVSGNDEHVDELDGDGLDGGGYVGDGEGWDWALLLIFCPLVW